MTRLNASAVLALCLLTGCSRLGAGGTHYEYTVDKGAKNITDTVLKMNTSNGQAWIYGSNMTTFNAVSDSAALPSGDYHFLEWDVPYPDGAWAVYRYDGDTGHTWILHQSQTGNSFSWNEVKTAQPPQ